MRYFKVISVSKPAQGNSTTSFQSLNNKLIRGKSAASAASKAFSKLCNVQKSGKKVHGRCALSITLKEVHSTGKDKLKKSGTKKLYRYRIRRKAQQKEVTFHDKNGKPTTVLFKSGVNDIKSQNVTKKIKPSSKKTSNTPKITKVTKKSGSVIARALKGLF